jgi:hypothetical protein
MRLHIRIFQLQRHFTVSLALNILHICEFVEEFIASGAVGIELRYVGVQGLSAGYDGLGVEVHCLPVVLLLEGSVACFFEGLDWRYVSRHIGIISIYTGKSALN